MGRKRVGLALSGAVARGAAHIGVLRVLERAGIPIDVIAGTSAGSLVGAMYCAGITLDQMQAQMAKMGWGKIASLVFPRQGFVSFDKLERWLIQQIGDLEFGELQRPFAAVTTDLEKGEPVVLYQGPVARAVHASCCVPGFIVPVVIEGRRLFDGGVTANLPVAAARALGADYVIGVDMFVHHIRPRLGPLGYGFAALETLVRYSGGGAQTADHVITPELAGSNYLRFDAYNELIAKGEAAAQAALPAICADLERETSAM